MGFTHKASDPAVCTSFPAD